MQLTLILIPDGSNPKEELHVYSASNIKHILLFNDFLTKECFIYDAEEPEKIILDFGYIIILMYGDQDILTWIPSGVTEHQIKIMRSFYDTYLKFTKMEYATLNSANEIESHGYQEVTIDNLNKFFENLESKKELARARIKKEE